MQFYDLFAYYISKGIDPNSLLYLVHLYKYDTQFVINDVNYKNLAKYGLVYKRTSKNKIELTLKAKRLIDRYFKISDPFTNEIENNTTDIDNNFNLFCEEYRNLFPSGIKSGGRPIKGDKLSIRTKMQKFIKKYPEYSREYILEVVKSYITEKKEVGYSFITCADYLIDKNQSSQLAALCDDYKNKPEDLFKETKLIE